MALAAVEQLKPALGLRQLPEGWKWAEIEEVCSVNPRRPQVHRSEPTPTSFLPMSGVDEVNGIISSLEIRPFVEVARGFTYFQEGDVLFAKITPSMENGKCAIARNLIDGIGFGSTEFHVLRPGPYLTPEWLHFYIRRLPFRREAKRHFRGAVGQQRVPDDFLKSFPVPVPPSPDTQHRIVARIEALLAEVKKARTLLDYMRRDAGRLMDAALKELVSQLPTTRRPLVEVIEAKPRNGWSPKCDDNPNGTPVLKLGAVLWFRYNPNEVKRTSEPVDHNAHFWLQPGDILISRSNTSDLVGHASIYTGEPFPCIYPDLLMRLRVRTSEANSRFLIYWLRTREVREHINRRASGASPTMKKIKQDDVCNIPFPAIDLSEQMRWVAHLDSIQTDVDNLFRLLDQHTKILDQLEQSILEQAFRGEL